MSLIFFERLHTIPNFVSLAAISIKL